MQGFLRPRLKTGRLSFLLPSIVAQLVKNPPAMQETWVLSLGWEDPLEKGKATLQYSGLENSMDCVVCGISKSWTRQSDLHYSPKHVISQIQIQEVGKDYKVML